MAVQFPRAGTGPRRAREVDLMKPTWIVVLGLSIAVPASSDPYAPFVRVPIEGRGVLCLERPATWRYEVQGPLVGPTIEFGPTSEPDFSMLITAIPVPKGRIKNKRELETMVRNEGKEMLPTSIQEQIDLIPVTGPQQHVGFLYHLTDRKSEVGPGDYREIHRGAVQMSSVLLSVTILTHTGDTQTVDVGLRILETAS